MQTYATLKCTVTLWEVGNNQTNECGNVLFPLPPPTIPRPSLLVAALASHFPTAASCQLTPSNFPTPALLPPTPTELLATLIFSSHPGMFQPQACAAVVQLPRRPLAADAVFCLEHMALLTRKLNTEACPDHLTDQHPAPFLCSLSTRPALFFYTNS